MGYYEDVYSSPERHGLRIVSSMEWADECYEFDITVAWQDENGRLYWGDDSGCSCPSPFENVNSVTELSSGSFHQLASQVEERLAKMRRPDSWSGRHLGYAEAEAVKFLAKVSEATS